jgi:16S rRNA processing protein RimM
MTADNASGTTAPDHAPLIMGRIAGPYGVKGWVRVTAYTGQAGDLLAYTPWYLERGGTWQACEVPEGRVHGKGLVVRLADCRDRAAAEALAGTAVGIYREQLPQAAPGEYYWSDLLGARVVTLEGRELGTVDHLLETGANDVLVVKGERERLIPFIQGQVIDSVDLAAGEIRVDWDPEF